jgi:hypothetical protein
MTDSIEQLGFELSAEAYLVAASWIEPLLQENRVRIARLSGYLTLACVLLGIEVVLWTASLVD